MTHTYHITGMTCAGCRAKVQDLLSAVPGVKNVSVDLAAAQATVEMERHIPTGVLRQALAAHPKYQLSENHQVAATWLSTYKPILLIFAYILGTTVLAEVAAGGWSGMRWMNHFMSGFFLVFSFFKFLNLKGFADSYGTYDLVAGTWDGWGYVYPFVELALGLGYLADFRPFFTNVVTFVVMTISLPGVLRSVLGRRRIRCACLGAVFNLPMSTVAIIEDASMIVMSAIMLVRLV